MVNCTSKSTNERGKGEAVSDSHSKKYAQF
jgi:hypothetical protein